MRNGNRWRVYAIDRDNNRIAARRLDDGARAFAGDYLSKHITYGYAVTVHSAQGVTADTTHTVLGENTTRTLLYVAMTRGRESNTAYLYQRTAGEDDDQHREHEYMHAARRGNSRDAAQLMRDIIAHDERPRTAHEVAAITERQHLSEPIRSLGDRRKKATECRRTKYADWQKTQTLRSDTERCREQHATQTSNRDYGIHL